MQVGEERDGLGKVACLSKQSYLLGLDSQSMCYLISQPSQSPPSESHMYPLLAFDASIITKPSMTVNDINHLLTAFGSPLFQSDCMM